jgi:hypothetical protein
MNVAQNTVPKGNVSENRHAAIFGVGIGFIVFDSIVIALRIYARAFMLRALGTDDSESMESISRTNLTKYLVLMIIGAVSGFQPYGWFLLTVQSDTQFWIINNDHDRIQLWNRKTRACHI